MEKEINELITVGEYQTQKEFFGVGAREELSRIIDELHPRNIFLVTGKGSFDHLDDAYNLTNLLGDTASTRFSDFEPNPKLTDVKLGIKIFKQSNADVIVAIGGGSVIDTAKAINTLAAQEGSTADFVKGDRIVEKKGKPFIAMPTTSGTGSESTHFAVIYIGKTKYSLTDTSILPDYAIVDPELTFGLPREIAASTGLDAFSQAIESYWSNRSTEESKAHASQALTLLMEHLVPSVNTAKRESRIAQSQAAHLAGKAINISFTTASHAVSYPITSYFGVPHGHAVALTIPSILVFNSQVNDQDVQDDRGEAYVKGTIDELVKLLGADTPQHAADKISTLMREIGVETRLSKLGIKSDDHLATIIEHGFNPARVKNNPRKLTRETLRSILQSIR